MRCVSDWSDSDRKSTRLNSSHLVISYAVFCLKKKKLALHFGLRLRLRRFLGLAGRAAFLLRRADLLLALLASDGPFGARDVTISVDEVDVVRIHLEPTVGDFFLAFFGNARLLSLDLPHTSVLHVVHEVLLTLDTQLCDFLRHLGSPPSESLRKLSSIVSVATILSRDIPDGFSSIARLFIDAGPLRQVDVLLGLAVTRDERAPVEPTPGRDQRQARSDQERLDLGGLHQTVTQGEVPPPTLGQIPGVEGLVVKRHGQYRSVRAGFDAVALAVHRRSAGPRIAESRLSRAPAPIEKPLFGRERIEGEPTAGHQRRPRAPKKAQQIGVGLAVLDGVKRRHGKREAGRERQGTQVGAHQERAPSAGD